jgi:hypothetical protein
VLSMEAESCSNLSLEEAASLLAKEAVARKHAPHAKQANVGETLSNAWKNFDPQKLKGQLASGWKALSPVQQAALAGAGGGAVLGGVSSLARDKDERQPVQSAMTGALAGGLLGGGAGLAANAFRRSRPKIDQKAVDAISKIQQMTPEQLNAIKPSDVAGYGESVLNAIEHRKNTLVNSARGEVGNNYVPGALGSGAVAAGVLGYETKGRKMLEPYLDRRHQDRDIYRGYTDMPAKDRNAHGSIKQLQEALRKRQPQGATGRPPVVGVTAGSTPNQSTIPQDRIDFARKLRDAGAAQRKYQKSPGRVAAGRGLRGGAAVGLPMLINWLANNAAKNKAEAGVIQQLER